MVSIVKQETDPIMETNENLVDANNLDVLEGEDYFNTEELDEKEVLGDNDIDTVAGSGDNTVKKELNGGTSTENEDHDLYDAAIEPSNATTAVTEKRESVEIQSSLPSNPVTKSGQTVSTTTGTTSTSGRRYCCYIGNMTWWTTDQDLQTEIEACGIFDLVDIKFYENRANGQSKGYALGVFASDTSVKNLMERLPQRKIQDQTLVVLPYTKQSLAKLEEATKRTDTRSDKKTDEKTGMPYVGTVRIGATGNAQMQPIGLNQITTSMPPRSMSSTIGSGGPTQSAVPGSQPPTSLMSLSFPQNPPTAVIQQNPPTVHIRPVTAQAIGPPTGFMQQQPLQALLQQQRGPINLAVAAGQSLAPMGGINQMSRPPPTLSTMQQNAGLAGQPSLTSLPPPLAKPAGAMPGGMNLAAGLQPAMHQQTFPPPGAHINPQVYPGFAAHNFHGHADNGGMMSDAEFEEIMNRNRTVSSSAISRAVSDASAGDYGSAIETLVTAISLIRQSRVAHDDRCKVLVASLQDTLNGIESKSYMHKSSRSRRDRSRTPEDRGRKRHRRSRTRSRSPRYMSGYEYSPRRGGGRY